MKTWVTVAYFGDLTEGTIWELDAAHGTKHEVLRFNPEKALRVPSKGFAGASWMGRPGKSPLLVCGAAAVFRFAAESLALEGVLARPDFNDLHHVHAAADRMYVANTGLDTVSVFDLDGRVLGAHSFDEHWLTRHRIEGRTVPREFWARSKKGGWAGHLPELEDDQPGGDYYSQARDILFSHRKVRDYVHPNHVWVHEGRVLVSSLLRRGVIDVTTWEQVVHCDVGVHDGQVVGGELWLTRVDGVVERRRLKAPQVVEQALDVTRVSGVSGWCRGLRVDDEVIWAGFTEIRQPPVHTWRNTDWDGTRTAVVAVSKESGEPTMVFDLSELGRHSKVFGIVEAP